MFCEQFRPTVCSAHTHTHTCCHFQILTELDTAIGESGDCLLFESCVPITSRKRRKNTKHLGLISSMFVGVLANLRGLRTARRNGKYACKLFKNWPCSVPSKAQSTRRACANSNANPLMLLVCSVDIPIHIKRFHMLALRVRVQCALGLMEDPLLICWPEQDMFPGSTLVQHPDVELVMTVKTFIDIRRE